MKRSIIVCQSICLAFAVLFPIQAQAQRHAVPLKYPPPAGVYSCSGYGVIGSEPIGGGNLIGGRETGFGDIQLDGEDKYSSNNYEGGQYTFNSSTGRLRFTSGALAGWTGAWEKRGGDVRIRFPQTQDTRLKPDTSMTDTVCYLER